MCETYFASDEFTFPETQLYTVAFNESKTGTESVMEKLN